MEHNTKSMKVSTNVQCACGKTRTIYVQPGDFLETRIAEEPCDCGRFVCWIGHKTKSVIDEFIND